MEDKANTQQTQQTNDNSTGDQQPIEQLQIEKLRTITEVDGDGDDQTNSHHDQFESTNQQDSDQEYDDEEQSEEEDYSDDSSDQQRQSQHHNKKNPAIKKLQLGRIAPAIHDLDRYKSRSCRDMQHNKIMIDDNDMIDKQENILAHKNMQLKFMGQENADLQQKINDLKSTVKINKEIIGSLVENSTGKDKQALIQMTQENRLLTSQYENVCKQRDDIAAQQLILTQIVEDLRNKEDQVQDQAKEEETILQATLDRKEYLLQKLELKVYHYEKYLQRKALSEDEPHHLLLRFQYDDELQPKIQKVSNVIEDNTNLRKELKAAFQEINKLEEERLKTKEEIFLLKEDIVDHKHKIKQFNQLTATGNQTELLSELQQDENELSLFQTNPYDDQNREPDVLNMERLKQMSQICPKDYLKKIETLLVSYDQELRKLNKELKHLRSSNTALQETEEENRRIIQQLKLAFDKLKEKQITKQNSQNQEVAPINIDDSLPEVKVVVEPIQEQRPSITDKTVLKVSVLEVEEDSKLPVENCNFNSAKQLPQKIDEMEDQFNGDLSSIFINPGDISIAMQGGENPNMLQNFETGRTNRESLINLTKEIEAQINKE